MPVKHSTDRILTTHVGSLPRPAEVLETLDQKESGGSYDRALWDERVRKAVAEAVRDQVEAGIDIITDGELGKNSFTLYVTQRLTGLTPNAVPMSSLIGAAGGRPPDRSPEELLRASGFSNVTRRQPGRTLGNMPVNDGPLGWKSREYEEDIARLKAALEGSDVAEVFMPAVAVGQLQFMIPTTYYTSEEDYLLALAEVMKDEYEAIVDAGFVLQIDSPDFVMMRLRQYLFTSWEDYRKSIERRVEALNHALRNVPEDRIRFHICWGNAPGPHHNDVPLKDVVDLMLKVKAQAYSVEAANPRHAHEWEVWENVKLPDGKILIPGVIDTVTSHVEHPELVAQRIAQYANIVGRENVIPAPDCGFGTFVGWNLVGDDVMWMKFGSLVQGAALASDRLW
jgi:5-methyltetrahydropteroyltriglutamate--homocysteine methyltransferase